MNKTLSEYVGVCWHDVKDQVDRNWVLCEKVPCDGFIDTDFFTTPDGWQLIADKISERGEWDDFAYWLWNKTDKQQHLSSIEACFHREQPAVKAPTVYGAITAGAIGGKS